MVVCILGALCMFLVVLSLRTLYLIICENGCIPKSKSRHHPARTVIILGSGGHTTEMLRIVAGMESDRYSPRIYIRASTDIISEAKVRDLEGEASDYQLLDIRRSREVHQPYLASIWTTIIATLDSIPVIWTARPDLILCNGPGTDVLTHKWIRNATATLEACLDRTWESLNSGCWKDVSIVYRYCYSFCSILKSTLLLTRFKYEEVTENAEIMELNTLKEVILLIDKCLLLGAPPLSMPGLLPTVARKLNAFILKMSGNDGSTVKDLMRLDDDVVPRALVPGYAPVATCYQPSMEAFHRDIFQSKTPTILEGCMDHWKALHLWRNPEYLLRTAGVRTVPIEIGSRYTEEDWSQCLITFSEFLESYVTSDRSSKLGYLAQHELFDQVPELMDDISIPDYCSFSDTGDEATAPDINAWLGPGGTISPLHFDPKNNLLCQVFGVKQVVLFHPKETPNLYPYTTRLLSNTARVDPVNPDFETWPKFKEATGITCTLGPGEMLFIPPGWWHHVVALAPSFSVSFWWN